MTKEEKRELHYHYHRIILIGQFPADPPTPHMVFQGDGGIIYSQGMDDADEILRFATFIPGKHGVV